jgi:2-isopropylmalate synthase
VILLRERIMEKVIIFDTTLRDGEQAAGASLNLQEKLEIARQLDKLGIDVIEVGFPASSVGEFEAISLIARELKRPTICALTLASIEAIDRAWEAVKEAKHPRIHVFLSASDIHLAHQLRRSRDEVLKMSREMVARAKSYLDDVEFSPMDASRADPAYIYQILEAVINAGATTVNIPDTVGYATPQEFGGLIRGILDNVPNIDKAVVSVHCHNDLGLAVANSLEAIRVGARQVECTINGIGERAGNASLEEIVMALKSGIHQDGVLKKSITYEIMDPKSVGIPSSALVLSKVSGRHAFKERLSELGYTLNEEALNSAFQGFKRLADKKKEITDRDIESLIAEELRTVTEVYHLDHVEVSCGDHSLPTATVRLIGPDGQSLADAALGTGPVDAIYKAINRIVGIPNRLTEFTVKSVSEGIDAIGEVLIRIESEGVTYTGRGAATDIIVASAKAYMNALNRLLAARGGDSNVEGKD